MASIQHVKAGRHTADRLVESRRVNGKPRPIPRRHLGTADQLLHRLLTPAPPRCPLRSYQHGEVTARKALADRLGLGALIAHHGPASRRSLAMGPTWVLAALQRAVWPCAKRAWAPWAQRPSGPRLFAIAPDPLTRQDCWAPLEAVSGRALEASEADLTRPVGHDVQRQLAPLFYDTAHFFSYWASGNERSPRAPRGHAQPKRGALRPCSRAVLVTREGPSPLSADV